VLSTLNVTERKLTKKAGILAFSRLVNKYSYDQSLIAVCDVITYLNSLQCEAFRVLKFFSRVPSSPRVTMKCAKIRIIVRLFFHQ